MNKRIFLTISQLTGGGAERVVSVWASELAELGYDVGILLSCGAENEYPISDKVKIHAISPTYAQYRQLSLFQKIMQRRKLLKQEKPEYLISFLPHVQKLSMFASLGLGIKRIETVRVSPWHASSNKGLSKLLWKICYATGHKIILQSSDQAPYFGKRMQKKCVIIPNPISRSYIDHFKTDHSGNITRFIAAGRIATQKNYPMMIRGFAKVISAHAGENLVLDIYGAEDGQAAKELQQLIQTLHMEGNIFLRGRTPFIQKEYCSSDVYLMTSNYEGMPNALMEAMASGLVCISTDCKTGPRDLIEDGANGFLVPVGDVDALAECIQRVLQMSEKERIAMAQAARERILTYCSVENNTAALAKLLKLDRDCDERNF